MKLRRGFVSNSSSSSFLVVFPNKITENNVSTYFNIEELVPLIKEETFIDKRNMSDQEIRSELEDLFIKLSDFSEETLLDKSLCDSSEIDFTYIINDYKARLQAVTDTLDNPDPEVAIYGAYNRVSFLKFDYDKLIEELMYHKLLHKKVEHKYEYSFGNDSEYFDYPSFEATLSDFQKDVIVCLEMNGWDSETFLNHKNYARLKLH